MIIQGLSICQGHVNQSLALRRQTMARTYLLPLSMFLQVLRADRERVHVDAVLEPPICVRDGDVVAAHLALFHQALLVEGPVL